MADGEVAVRKLTSASSCRRSWNITGTAYAWAGIPQSPPQASAQYATVANHENKSAADLSGQPLLQRYTKCGSEGVLPSSHIRSSVTDPDICHTQGIDMSLAINIGDPAWYIEPPFDLLATHVPCSVATIRCPKYPWILLI